MWLGKLFDDYFALNSLFGISLNATPSFCGWTSLVEWWLSIPFLGFLWMQPPPAVFLDTWVEQHALNSLFGISLNATGLWRGDYDDKLKMALNSLFGISLNATDVVVDVCVRVSRIVSLNSLFGISLNATWIFVMLFMGRCCFTLSIPFLGFLWMQQKFDTLRWRVYGSFLTRSSLNSLFGISLNATNP